MTLLQISEKIRDHLTKQHDRSTNDHGSCKYRADSGLMCAVGCLIDDGVYEQWLEGKMANDPDIIDALERSGVAMDEATIDLARAWQQYHDSSYSSNDVQSDASYSYSVWNRSGNDANSPATVHDIIMKELTQ